MLGGRGNDTLNARDATRDFVDGGSGSDGGRTDGVDRIVSLELPTRS
jgi:hypothetical protein